MADEDILEEQDLKENKSKKIFIYGGIGLVQVVVAFVLVYFLIYPKFTETGQGTDGTGEIENKKERKPLGILHKISGLTVNPKNTGGNRFAVFEIVFEMQDEKTKTLVAQYEPVITDKLLAYLRSRTVEELSYQHLTTTIKSDIMNLVNETLVDNKVTNVYFTRFVLE